MKESSRTQPNKIPDLPPSWMLLDQVWKRHFHIRKFRLIPSCFSGALSVFLPHPLLPKRTLQMFLYPFYMGDPVVALPPGQGGSPRVASGACSRRRACFARLLWGRPEPWNPPPPHLPWHPLFTFPLPPSILHVCCRDGEGVPGHCCLTWQPHPQVGFTVRWWVSVLTPGESS